MSQAVSPPKLAAYGSWRSSITAQQVAAQSVGLGLLALDTTGIYCLESRPNEGGRNVIVLCQADGKCEDITPPPFNARTRVNEYGGGSYAVRDGVVVFSHVADGRLYRQDPGAEPQALTEAGPYRYADMLIDSTCQRVLCVREDHGAKESEAQHSLVAIDLAGKNAIQQLAMGDDFYSSPTLSPDGRRLAWLSWNHPNMPWDGTQLFLADLDHSGRIMDVHCIAGGAEESIFQPQWSPSGELYFVSDRSGWWNLYRYAEAGVECLLEREAEFGLPQWVFGMSTYAFSGPDQILACYCEQGIWHLGVIDVQTRQLREITTPYNAIDGIRAANGQAVFLATGPTQATAVVHYDAVHERFRQLRSSSQMHIDAAAISQPQAIRFASEGNKQAYGFYYPPQNPLYRPLPDSLPPLLVKSHGGPTAAASPGLNLKIQYWTSRGFAVLDVNYSGSTGYGRAYRERLNGRWGVADVDDCVHGAQYLVQQGLVDGQRLLISGGSAGGYTTLCALTFRDVFKAGASYYGISELEALVRDTHKFESRYLDKLIGPYPAEIERYRQRSPIYHSQQLACPVIFLQGLEDKVVPPNQAEMMVQALRDKGLAVAYLTFAEEQHGFRQAASIVRALEAELYFYARVLGFSPADPIEPVEISNLED